MKKYDLIAMLPLIIGFVAWIVYASWEHGLEFIIPLLVLMIVSTLIFLWMKYWMDKSFKEKK